MRLTAVALMIFIGLYSTFSNMQLYAQKKVDQVIPDAEKKKIIRARKLFNEFKIYQGEKILKDLVKDHPYEAYYHEALVQIQHQVLEQIRTAGGALQHFQPVDKKDTITNEDYTEETIFLKDSAKQIKQEIASKELSAEENGLDRSPNRKRDRKERKLDKAKNAEPDEPIQQDAIVTIDSSLLKNDSEETLDDAPKIKGVKVNSALGKKLKLLSEVAEIPYEPYKFDLIQNARRATLNVEHSDSASAYLREFLIDTLSPNLHVNESAMSFFENGMEDFLAKDYVAAAKYFEKAIEQEEHFYNALLKLGDTYYALGKDTSAQRLFKEASTAQPNRPEPLERLAQMSYQNGKYEEAAAYIIQSIAIYPQQSYFNFLKLIISKTGREFNSQWIRRDVYPLTTAHNYEELIAKEKTPWWQYQNAKQDVYSYFDTIGIVRPNDKTKERYLEVYAWKKMLQNTKRDVYPFARAMAEIGYLDCFTLITCFHNDLYGQFHDLVKRHPEKIKEYFYIVLNWEDKKFDMLRKKVAPKEKEKDAKD